METIGTGLGMNFIGAGALGMNYVPITKDTFIPSEEDIFVHAGKEKQRLIFGEPLVYEDKEKELIQEFTNYLTENNLSLPEGYDERECFRYYQGCGYDSKKAFEGILENHEFNTKNLPVDIDSIEEALQSGMVYFYKTDIHFRPVWIINVKKLVKTELDEDILLKVTLAMADHVTKKYMRPGAIENWTVILDLKDVGVTQIPKKKLQSMVSILQSNFRGRLYKLFAINMPFMIRALWKLFKGMWDKFTQEKLSMYGGGYEADIQKVIPSYNLEKRFGGDLDDVESNFFPPQLE